MADARTSVLYGAIPSGGFGVLEEQEAQERAEELRAIMACTTVGALRAVAGSLRWTQVPLDPDDELRDDESFDWEVAVDEREGDWPTMPAQLMLDRLPSDLVEALIERAGATVEMTMINGEILEVPRDRESAVVAVLDDLGIAHRRDDDVFGVLGLESLHV